MENKFVYVVWCAKIKIGHPISYKPQYDMWVFPTYMGALRFVAINKAERNSQGWHEWRSMHREVFDYSNTNMLILELSNYEALLRFIVTRAPISQEIYRL